MQIIKQADGINSLTGPKNVDVGDPAQFCETAAFSLAHMVRIIRGS